MDLSISPSVVFVYDISVFRVLRNSSKPELSQGGPKIPVYALEPAIYECSRNVVYGSWGGKQSFY